MGKTFKMTAVRLNYKLCITLDFTSKLYICVNYM